MFSRIATLIAVSTVSTQVASAVEIVDVDYSKEARLEIGPDFPGVVDLIAIGGCGNDGQLDITFKRTEADPDIVPLRLIATPGSCGLYGINGVFFRSSVQLVQTGTFTTDSGLPFVFETSSFEFSAFYEKPYPLAPAEFGELRFGAFSDSQTPFLLSLSGLEVGQFFTVRINLVPTPGSMVGFLGLLPILLARGALRSRQR